MVNNSYDYILWRVSGFGLCYVYVDNHVKTLESFKDCIRCDSSCASAYSDIGTSNDSLSNYKDVIVAVNEGILNDSEQTTAHDIVGFS